MMEHFYPDGSGHVPIHKDSLNGLGIMNSFEIKTMALTVTRSQPDLMLDFGAK